MLNFQTLVAQDYPVLVKVFEENKNSEHNDTLRLLDLDLKVYKTKNSDSVEYYIVNNREPISGINFHGIFTKRKIGYLYYNFEKGIDPNGLNCISIINQDTIINLITNHGNVIFLSLFEKGYKNWHGSDYLPIQNISLTRVEDDLIKKDLNNTLYRNFIFLSKGIRTFEELKIRCF